MKKSKKEMQVSMVACAVCGKETGEIVLYPGVEEHMHVITGAVCDECKKKFDEGYSALLLCNNRYGRNSFSSMKEINAARKGPFMFVKKDFFKRLTGHDITNHNVICVEQEVFDKLHQMAERAEVNAADEETDK